MKKSGRQTEQQIKRQKFLPADFLLKHSSGQPEEKHIPDQMHQSAMKEYRRKNLEEIKPGRNKAPLPENKMIDSIFKFLIQAVPDLKID